MSFSFLPLIFFQNSGGLEWGITKNENSCLDVQCCQHEDPGELGQVGVKLLLQVSRQARY